MPRHTGTLEGPSTVGLSGTLTCLYTSRTRASESTKASTAVLIFFHKFDDLSVRLTPGKKQQAWTSQVLCTSPVKEMEETA